ncbi:MAG: hypothetical protein EOM77_04920 [Bacteroidia bacterium]|nr:hypothetical protein [Bacteroidia bacterium]
MTNYTPVIQQIFEVNRVLAPIHNRRMRRWLMDPTGWRAAVWDNAVVIGNVDCETPLGAITVQTPFGTVTYENLRKNGFAILTQDGHWVLWGGGKLSLNGELLAASSSDESALVFNRHHLSMASYGFFDPKKEPKRKLSDRAWTLSGSSLSKVLESGNLMAWPSQEPYVLAKKGDSFECPAPGWKQTVRTK